MCGNMAICASNEARNACPKARHVLLQDGLPTGIGGVGQGLGIGRIDVGVAQHVILRMAWPQRDQVEQVFHKLQQILLPNVVDALRPIVPIVVRLCQTGIDDADGILRAGDIGAAGRVVAAEEDPVVCSRSSWGSRLPHRSMAVRRVLLAMPLRSLNSTVGSMESVMTEPG